jgi:hypothetical protein
VERLAADRAKRADRPRVLILITFDLDDYEYDALRAGASVIAAGLVVPGATSRSR